MCMKYWRTDQSSQNASMINNLTLVFTKSSFLPDTYIYSEDLNVG